MKLNEKARDWLMVLPVGAAFFALWPILGRSKSFATAISMFVFYVIISQIGNEGVIHDFGLL